MRRTNRSIINRFRPCIPDRLRPGRFSINETCRMCSTGRTDFEQMVSGSGEDLCRVAGEADYYLSAFRVPVDRARFTREVFS